MNPIFFKELRENFKWALVIAGVLSLFIYFGEIREARSNFFFHIADPGVTLIPMALAGLLLGIAQNVFEIRPDNWAFMIQRPVSRGAIYWNKCAAGLVLLYGAILLPCVLATMWAVQPGNIAMPFQGRMLLPMLANGLAAAPFYFAGILLTLRRARWFGTRLLPLGLAIGCGFCAFFAPQFWQTALVTLAGTAIGAAAGWNAFSTGGACNRGGASSFALGAMVFAGALGIGCLLVAMLTIFQTNTVWHDQRVDRNGNVLRITLTLDGRERTSVVNDVEGRPIPEYEGVDLDDSTGETSDRFVRFSDGMVDERRIEVPGMFEADFFGYRTPTPGIVGVRGTSKPGMRLRRSYLFDVNDRVIDVYDSLTRLFVGFLGPNGFVAGDQLPEERFAGMPLNAMAQGSTHTLAFPTVVDWMELDQQRLKPIFTAEADDPVVAATELGPASGLTVVVVTRNKLHVMRPDGESIFSVAHELDLSKCWFNLALLPSSKHLLLQANPLQWLPVVEQYRLLEFDMEGKVVRQSVAPPMEKAIGQTKLRRTAMMGVIYPAAALPLFSPWTMDEVFELDTSGHAALFYGCLFGSATLCAAVTWLISRRCGFGTSKTLGWTLATALFGPAGIVVLLGLNTWPVRQRCLVCNRMRLVDRRYCSCCGAPLAPPAREGREIFEPEGAFEVAS